MPEPMTLEHFDRFVAQNEGRFPVAWRGADAGLSKHAGAGAA
jgi:hypothetical protein